MTINLILITLHPLIFCNLTVKDSKKALEYSMSEGDSPRIKSSSKILLLFTFIQNTSNFGYNDL
jgi:hypothetical protein